jgi:pimeloyl-ACP methyl ester carboxylesterase
VTRRRSDDEGAGAGREAATLPVGFERFHRRRFIDYQLNRAHALGFADRADLHRAAARIRRPTDAVAVFEDLATQAVAAGRFDRATSYLRVAEFFTPPGSPEHLDRYRRYRSSFDAAFAPLGAVRHEVAYGGSTLPAYMLRADGVSRGTVLVHGGFDSLIEEFLAIWLRIAAAGFDVIAFDGPGQGGARALDRLPFDHDWEKPVGAVLDHFEIDRAALVGISMGGYWALRAAGREPRIDRVVSWPPVYDWLLRLPRQLRGPARAMLRRRRFMRVSIRLRARLVPTLRQIVDQVLYITDRDDPIAVVDWFLAMNPDHLDSDRVTQDVLLLSGEHDAFQPPAYTRAQAEALTAARSVTVRTFSAAEHADQHCQMGNLSLACDVLTEWMTRDRPG